MALAVIFVGLAAFGLGRLSVLEERREPVKIEYPENKAAAGNYEEIGNSVKTSESPKANESKQAETNAGGLLVASKSGTKYHFPWCSGAKSISGTNKIWFSSEEEARAAGYQPASNCKGLK